MLKLPSFSFNYFNFILCHHLVSAAFLPLSVCCPDNSPTVLHPPPSPLLSHFLPFSLCGQGVRLKPSREERLPSTQANICPALNWANTDKANTISFSVPGCLPCCPFIPFLSFRRCRRAGGWLINLMPCTSCFSSKSDTVIRFRCMSFYMSVWSLLGTPVQSKAFQSSWPAANPTCMKLTTLTKLPASWCYFGFTWTSSPLSLLCETTGLCLTSSISGLCHP